MTINRTDIVEGKGNAKVSISSLYRSCTKAIYDRSQCDTSGVGCEFSKTKSVSIVGTSCNTFILLLSRVSETVLADGVAL